MSWDKSKHDFRQAKDWIIYNQAENGRISWDEKGKSDPWDHCECLIALAIFEEWDAFDLGIKWFFDNLNDEGCISPEYKNNAPVHDHYESHHAPYIILPLMQAILMGRDDLLNPFIKSQIKIIFDQLHEFKDSEGYYFWAKDKKGFSDNSLITASMSIFLSLKAFDKFSSIEFDKQVWDSKFNRDGVDRSRFSMDFYYPFMCGVKTNKLDFQSGLKDFYVDGLGIKCVKEEPWVTIAESCECVIAALVVDDYETAQNIFNNILQFKNDNGIFPTGYQYEMDIFWPEENSTWTNAAVIIAAHALATYGKKEASKGNVFFYLNNLLESDQAINSFK
ncbi:hypothetical protein OAI17_02020 [Gammaproteobacteria bacterium]|nr:hypothetical protein [Gammaproteobacteria bacterium]